MQEPSPSRRKRAVLYGCLILLAVLAALLPKLISGRLRIDDAERFVGTAV